MSAPVLAFDLALRLNSSKQESGWQRSTRNARGPVEESGTVDVLPGHVVVLEPGLPQSVAADQEALVCYALA